MRFLPSCVLLSGLLIGTAACDRPENAEDRQAREQKVDQAAHQAGEDIYKATQKTKEATEEAAQDLKKAGREVKQGWEDAKHGNPDDKDSTQPKQ
jgi:protein tyrosine phosphatase (PTP) superfamily phosphohydrolase (DUF442 family)